MEITETGRALRAAGLRIIDTLLTSYTELIANPAAAADAKKRHAMGQIYTLLQGVLEARGKVLVKLNVGADALDDVIEILPAMKAPTVNELFQGAGYAVETVVPRSEINITHPSPARPGRHRHSGDAHLQDRPLGESRHEGGMDEVRGRAGDRRGRRRRRGRGCHLRGPGRGRGRRRGHRRPWLDCGSPEGQDKRSAC